MSDDGGHIPVSERKIPPVERGGGVLLKGAGTGRRVG